MKAVVHRLTELCLARPVTVLVAALVVVGVAASGLARLTFDNRPDNFFLKGDRSIAVWKGFKERYASDEFSFVVLSPAEADEGFVATLRGLTERLGELDGAERITSLTNVRSLRDRDGALDVGDYLRADLGTEETLARIAAAPAHPYYGGLFASADGAHFGIVVETDPDLVNEDKAVLTDAMRALLAEADYASLSPRVIGAPVLDTDVQRIVATESGLFGALTMGLVLAGLALAYRSWLGLILPVLVAVPSILVTLGGMGHVGVPAGLLTPIIPSFLISVGLGSAVYLMTAFHRLRRQGVDNEAAIREAMAHAGAPAILANATTAGALFAFSGSRVLPVQHVGIALGVGLLVALALTLLLFPILAARLGGSIRERGSSANVDSKGLAHVAAFVLARPRGIIAVFAIAVLVGVAGMLRLQTDYYYLGTFKDDTPIAKDYAASNAAIPVSNSIEVVVRTDRVDAFHEPAALAALDALAAKAASATASDLPVKSYSLADVLKELSQETLGSYAIPEERATVAQLLLLFEGSGTDELTRLTTPDYDEARLTLMVPARPYSGYEPAVAAIEREGPAILREAGLDHALIDVTGVVPLWMRLSTFLTESQISSFAAAALVVSVVMVLVLRSITLGLCMMLVNAGCVVIVLGGMGWFGILLDPFTILIGAIALGILDDDTIHFVVCVRDRVAEGLSASEAIRSTYQVAGNAMGLQTIVLVTAFLIYGLSSVASLTLFGFITATTILLGLVIEYLVTPAILVVLSPHLASGNAHGSRLAARPE